MAYINHAVKWMKQKYYSFMDIVGDPNIHHGCGGRWEPCSASAIFCVKCGKKVPETSNLNN